MICRYVNQRETHLSLKAPYELVKGSDSSKETFGPENWVPWVAILWHCATGSQASENITAGCPLIANPCFQKWDKFERSFDTNGLSWDVSKWRSLFKREPHWAATQESTAMPSGGGNVGGGESSKMVNNPVPSEDRRQSLFYILPLSLRWAIAFLPRRLRRAMKAKKSFRDVQRIFKFTIKSSMTIFSSQGNLWSVRAALKQFPFQPVF